MWDLKATCLLTFEGYGRPTGLFWPVAVSRVRQRAQQGEASMYNVQQSSAVQIGGVSNLRCGGVGHWEVTRGAAKRHRGQFPDTGLIRAVSLTTASTAQEGDLASRCLMEGVNDSSE